MDDTTLPSLSPHRSLQLNQLIFYPLASPLQPPYLLPSHRVLSTVSDKPSEPESNTSEQRLVLTEQDIQNLVEQGISEENIAELTEAVNEQLSSNANAKDSDKDKNSRPNDEEKPSSFDLAILDNDIQQAVKQQVHSQLNEQLNQQLSEQQKEQQEAQYEAFKQYLAKKNSEQSIDYRQVRLNIESGGLPTRTFYLLNGLAAVIAGFGLLANSPAVVIGAMLVAMLIGPISGIALAIIDARFALLKKSLLTLLSGGVLIYAIGMALGWLYPEQALSQEIIARTAPNTMDVMVALAGGTAGAYAMISRNLSVAVVGVAVATALVPPLTASGILLSVGQYQLAGGALLLTLTNIVAIQFTNALVLWTAGFRRLDVDEAEDEKVKDSKWQQSWLFIRRNAVSLVLLTVISVYLTLNFQQKIKQQNYQTQVKKIITDTIANQPNYVVSTSFDVADKTQSSPKANSYLIRVVLQGLTAPNYSDIQQMEQKIIALSQQQFPNRPPAKLQVRFVPEQVIETTPITKDDVKLDNASLNQINEAKK